MTRTTPMTPAQVVPTIEGYLVESDRLKAIPIVVISGKKGKDRSKYDERVSDALNQVGVCVGVMLGMSIETPDTKSKNRFCETYALLVVVYCVDGFEFSDGRSIYEIVDDAKAAILQNRDLPRGLYDEIYPFPNGFHDEQKGNQHHLNFLVKTFIPLK